MPIQIFIDGSAGTTGLRIVQRLAERAKTEPLTVRMLEGEQRKDLAARIDAINRSDVAFLCLPDAAAREIAPHIDPAVRVLDTSTAHRTAPGWVYGLPELHGTRAALEACRPYGLALHHKHLPEMQAVCGLEAPPLFVPVLGDYYAGMLTMLPLFPAQYGTTAGTIAGALAEYYAGEPMVTVHGLGQGTENGFLAANALAGSDRLEIFCLPSPDGAQLQLVSLFDNLGKGSSGAALQCMNAMLGLPETQGLSRT